MANYALGMPIFDHLQLDELAEVAKEERRYLLRRYIFREPLARRLLLRIFEMRFDINFTQQSCE